MTQPFNLQKFLKVAYYDDARGLVSRNSRAWPHCIRMKMEKGKKSNQEAIEECIKEYNTMDEGEWMTTYVEAYPDSKAPRVKNETPAAAKADKK